MKREQEYRKLAENVLKRAANEHSAQMRAEWEILAARYIWHSPASRKRLRKTTPLLTQSLGIVRGDANRANRATQRFSVALLVLRDAMLDVAGLAPPIVT